MPDAGMAEYQLGRQHRIIAACERWWPLTGPNGLPNRADCSGFVRSVADELGVPHLTGDANHIFHAIQFAPWSSLGFGDAAAQLAAVAATNGMFVVGAWHNPSGGNGHVAVIVDTNYSDTVVPHRSHAIAYWGRLGGEGDEYEQHTYCWGGEKRPHVLYAACDISPG